MNCTLPNGYNTQPGICNLAGPFKSTTHCIPVNEEAYPCTATWFHNDCKVSSGADERVSIAHGSVTDGGGGEEDGKTCEFRLSVKAIEISDDGVWSVAIRNGLGTVEDQCRLMLKVPKNYR